MALNENPTADPVTRREREFRESQKIRWYQWEFLRRNSEYGRDYERLMARFGTWFEKRGFWYQLQRGRAKYSDRDLLFYYNTIWPALREICAKWCISDPFPPEWIFEESGFREYAPRQRISIPTGYTSAEAAFFWNGEPVEFARGVRRGTFAERFKLQQERHAKVPKRKNTQQNPELLLLRIDVTRPQKEVIPLVLQAIRRYRETLSRTQSALLNRKGTRRRLDQYDIYLHVWDLRHEGHPFPEIAKRVYPKEYPHYPRPKNPITQRVHDHFRRAQVLIRGGYKELA